MMNVNLIKEAENHVRKRFTEESPKDNFYHDLSHTEDVVEGVNLVGKATGLTDDEMETALLAAWFHDLGYLEDEYNHEERSVDLAEKFLSEKKYPQESINRVTSAILSTRLPQNPKNNVEKTLCDADLLHLGKENFFEKNDLFRMELESKKDKIFDEYDWLENNVEFLTAHKFFTKFAQSRFQDQKNEHLLKLQKKLRKQKKKAAERELKEEKIAVQDEKVSIEKKKLKKKKEITKKASRGIETMFRNTMRTHVAFSEMADNKANIMISVNTIIITIIVSIMVRKLGANPHLIIPTVILVSVSLVTLIFATLVTRPNITEGTFTKEDIESKKANLLFFGNFFNMPFKDFNWGMQELINDRDFLYGSMIKDFYYLGQVLGQKYKYLRICYNIFMYGLIVSVIAYAIAFAMYPGATELGSIIE